jgi:hypothetical protein
MFPMAEVCFDKTQVCGWHHGTITSTVLNWFGKSMPTLFHTLYPKNKFIIAYPSPQEPTLFMLLVAKAYPLFRPQLLASITRMKAQTVKAPKYLGLLQDIQTLCEFCIPVVRFPTIIRHWFLWNS